MAHKRKWPNLPPYVYPGRWAYEFKPYLGAGVKRPTIRLCPLSAPISQVWDAWEQRQQKEDTGTLNWLLREYLESPEFATKAAKTIAGQKKDARKIINYPRGKELTFGSAQLNKITPGVIRKYLDSRAKDGAAVSGNRERALISKAWSWAWQRDLIRYPNPCQGVSRNPEKARDRYVTDEEYQAVYELAAPAPPYIRPMMEIAYLCRMRKSEILALTEADVLDEGLNTRRLKGSRDSITTWSDRLRMAVKSALNTPRRINRENGYLFADRHGVQIKASAFDSAWQRLRVRVKKQGIKPFTFHDLKAKGVSDFEGDK